MAVCGGDGMMIVCSNYGGVGGGMMSVYSNYGDVGGGRADCVFQLWGRVGEGGGGA